MRIPFAVGRITPRGGRQMAVIERRPPRRFPGPWQLRGSTRSAAPRAGNVENQTAT